MALPTTRPQSSTFRVAWFHCGVFLFVCIANMPFASSDEAFKAVADYPKHCYDGPGPADGDKIELLSPSCIFSLKGLNPDGVYQETGGIVIRTNMDGKWGEMRIQVDLKKSSTNEETEVNVQTSGWVHVGFEHDHISFHWNPAPGNRDFSGTSEVSVSVPSVVYVNYPEGKHAWSSWYGIDGHAASEQMELLAIPAMSGDSHAPLFIWNILRIEKVNGGWNFHITFTAIGERAGKKFEFTGTVVDGVLHDRF